MGKYRYDMGCITDCGNIRTVNQDSVLMKKGRLDGREFILAAVADGMGGREKGEMASSEITRGLKEWWDRWLCSCLKQTDPIRSIEASLGYTIEECNSRIVAMARDQGIRTGSTLSAVFMYNGYFIMKQIGDSRIYLYKKGKIEQITRDQTWCQQQIDKGALTQEEAENHEMSHVLLNAVGNDYGLEMETRTGFEPGTVQIVLCSDGAYHYLKKGDMVNILKSRKDCQEKAQEAYKQIKETRADDNFSVIIIRQEKIWW